MCSRGLGGDVMGRRGLEERGVGRRGGRCVYGGGGRSRKGVNCRVRGGRGLRREDWGRRGLGIKGSR